MLLNEKLVEIVGQENLTNKLEEPVPYSYDASMNVDRPDAAVWPESTEQVSKVEYFPIVPIFHHSILLWGNNDHSTSVW